MLANRRAVKKRTIAAMDAPLYLWSYVLFSKRRHLWRRSNWRFPHPRKHEIRVASYYASTATKRYLPPAGGGDGGRGRILLRGCSQTLPTYPENDASQHSAPSSWKETLIGGAISIHACMYIPAFILQRLSLPK